MYVVNQPKALLNKNACIKLELLKRTCELKEVLLDTNKFRSNFKPLFEGLGTMIREVGIELWSYCNSPYAICAPCSVPYLLINKVETKLHEMVHKGMIFHAEASTEWVSSISSP